jgi:phospholipid-binding lipoprotein MlaA
MIYPPAMRVLALLILLLLAPGAYAEPEGFNRANLSFNQWFLEHILEPTARGYNLLMPKWGQRRVVDFMGNLEGPRDIINSLAQAKFSRAGIHTGRFVVNTTLGFAGFYDVAGDKFDWTAAPETLDETFGVWHLPTGTYLILPVIGEFCTRSLVGWVGDGFLNPLTWLPGPPVGATAGSYVVRNVNLLAQGMPSPRSPQGEWDSYRQSRYVFHPYEVGKDLFFRDTAERVAE